MIPDSVRKLWQEGELSLEVRFELFKAQAEMDKYHSHEITRMTHHVLSIAPAQIAIIGDDNLAVALLLANTREMAQDVFQGTATPSPRTLLFGAFSSELALREIGEFPVTTELDPSRQLDAVFVLKPQKEVMDLLKPRIVPFETMVFLYGFSREEALAYMGENAVAQVKNVLIYPGRLSRRAVAIS